MTVSRTRVAAGAAGVAGACFAYGTLIERRWYRLRHLTVPGVMRPGAGLRILHVSDVHLHTRARHRSRFLAEVAAQPADLVVATGDLVGAADAENAAVDAIAPLVADRPGLVVLGSNDLYAPTFKSPHLYFTDPDARRHGRRLDTGRLVAGLEASGWQVLRNATTTVQAGDVTIAVAGLDDPHLPSTVLPSVDDLSAAAAEVSAPVDLRLGLVHAPYQAALDLLVDAGYDLLLAGHTHGGQVRFPPIGAVVANCDLPLRQARGLSRWGRAWLHVSPGLGASPYTPFRFACRPEATLLDVS